MWPIYVSTNVWKNLRLPVSASATVARKSFNGKFIAKLDFPMRAFYVTINDTVIGSLKSLHTLFDTYLDHMMVKFEQNRTVGSIQNF